MRTSRLIVGLVVTLGVFLFVLFSDHGLVKRIGLEQRRRELADEVTRLEQRKDSLRKRVKSLTKDTVEIERIARKYGMIKPGEEVLLVPPQ